MTLFFGGNVPDYSICICNYNMASTLERALLSVLDQVDERFEVVVVDDGSTDNSVFLLRRLQEQYPALRLVTLSRVPSRKLGKTRNISIQEARGKYVLLHIDCDDITAPYIEDFVEVYHQIEAAIGGDFLLAGHPINMGGRDFLLDHGPYRNIYRGEDRDLWMRLASEGKYIPLINTSIKQPLSKPLFLRLQRSITDTFDLLRNDFRKGIGLWQFMGYEWRNRFSLKARLVRALLFFPAWAAACVQGPLKGVGKADIDFFIEYKKEHAGTFEQILARYDAVPDWARLSSASRAVFKDIP